MNGPAASLFRIKLEFVKEGETRPVMPLDVDRQLMVAAADAEAAIERAHDRVRSEIPSGERARVVCAELIGRVDVQ